jgi:hypothetical protein
MQFFGKYWLPFLSDGRIVESGEAPGLPSFGLHMISIFKPKWMFGLFLLGVVAVLVWSLVKV